MGGSGDGIDGDDPFGDACRRDVGRILGLLDHPNFPTFWTALRTECLKIQQGIITSPNGFKKLAPFDASLTQRIEWLKINVLNPIERLSEALSASNQPHFRHWEEYGEAAPPDRASLLEKLNSLKLEANSISYWLEGEISGRMWDDKIRHGDEIRFSIVYTAIHAVDDYFPEFSVSRGNWDRELRKMTGIIPDYVRRVFFETTGQNEQLDGPMKDVVSEIRKLQKKSR